MANVNIKFNGKEFLLSCDDGQEDHLEELSNHLNEKFEGTCLAVSSESTLRIEVPVQNRDESTLF